MSFYGSCYGGRGYGYGGYGGFGGLGCGCGCGGFGGYGGYGYHSGLGGYGGYRYGCCHLSCCEGYGFSGFY